jgi:hypothetical protein
MRTHGIILELCRRSRWFDLRLLRGLEFFLPIFGALSIAGALRWFLLMGGFVWAFDVDANWSCARVCGAVSMDPCFGNWSWALMSFDIRCSICWDAGDKTCEEVWL